MIAPLIFLFRLLVLPSKPEHRLDAENVALRAGDHPATQAARSRAAHERRPAIGAAKKDYERAIYRDEEDSARRKFFGVRALPDLAKFRLPVDVELKMADLEGCDVVAAMFSKDAPDPAQIFADNKGPAVSAFELLPWALRLATSDPRAGRITDLERTLPTSTPLRQSRMGSSTSGQADPHRDLRSASSICRQQSMRRASRRSTIPAQGETALFSTALGAPVPIAHQEHGRGHAVAAVIEQARDGASV